MVIILCSLSSQSMGPALQLDRLKANYLVGFIDFVRLRSESFPKQTSIAVLNDDNLYRELRRIARDTVNGRELEIIHLKQGMPPPSKRIDIIYVKNSQDAHWQTIKEHFMEAEILLVGSDNRFIENGGAIQFVHKDNRLRLTVNQVNANRRGISLSSKLIEMSVDNR